MGNASAAGIRKLQDAYIAAKEALVAGIAALGAKKEIKQPNKSGQKGL